jgi:hypothetical protein
MPAWQSVPGPGGDVGKRKGVKLAGAIDIFWAFAN